MYSHTSSMQHLYSWELAELPEPDEPVTIAQIDTLVGQLADSLAEKYLTGMTKLRAREELANAMAWSELQHAVQWDHPFPDSNLDWSISTSDHTVYAYAKNNLVEISLEVRVD